MEPAWIPLACAPLAVGGLLWARWRERRRAELALKPLCSALFLATAALVPWPDRGYAALVTLGLVLGFLGDLALLGRGKRWLAAGLGAFLLGHGAYAAALAPRAAAAWPGWLLPLGLAALLAGVTAWVLREAWPKLGALRGPALGYGAALIGVTVVAAAAWLGRRDPASGLAALGLLLFFVSDLSVARQRFVREAFSNRLWGVPSYYAGQLLLALSIGAR